MGLFEEDERQARFSASEHRMELRRRIEKLRPDFEDARAKYDDIEWLRSALQGMEIMLDRIERYNPGEDRPEAGIMLLGEMKCSLMSIFGQLQPLHEIRELQQQLADLTDTDQTDSSPGDDEA